MVKYSREEDIAFLKNRWDISLEHMGSKYGHEKEFKNLIALYSEPHRKYHNINHMTHCIGEFQRADISYEEPSAVAVALLFHDAVLKHMSRKNEEDSANMAYEMFVGDNNLNSRYPLMVRNLVLATKPGAEAKTIDEKIIQDIDRSILGAGKSKFHRYNEEIRAEYIGNKKSALYNIARAGFLHDLLDRDFIYNTDYFRDKYEARARENLENSISKLSK